MSRNLLVTPGVRFGVQTHAGARMNVSPRVSAAWSPLRNGSLTVRGSYGDFYDWIAGGLYKQSLLFDGARLQDVNIVNPSWPDPGAGGAAAPSNQYLWSDAAGAAARAADERRRRPDRQQERPRERHLLLQLGPQPAARPQPERPGRAGSVPIRRWRTSWSCRRTPSRRRTRSAVSYSFVRLDWKRTFLMANYNLGSARTNTTGAFSLPANGDNLETEWGPSGGDIRHRIGGSINFQPWRDVGVSVNVAAGPESRTT